MREKICTCVGMTGSAIAALWGGWDAAAVTLLICMAIDYASGLVVAGVFRSSPKSASGTLDSRVGWKGLCRKGMTLMFVLIAYRLDLLLGVSYIKDAVTIGFVANEVISIVENAGLMGLPLPAAVTNAVDTLVNKREEGGKL